VADTRYRIPELPKPAATGWDVICDALGLTYKARGVRYHPVCVKDRMQMLERRENLTQWVLETGVSLESYGLTKSIEKINTRIKLMSREGDVLAQEANRGLEAKIGVFQEVRTIHDDMNQGQLRELARTTLNESSRPARSLSLSGLGAADVITGRGVYVVIKELDVKRTFYVEGDTHTFLGSSHRMSLSLSSENA